MIPNSHSIPWRSVGESMPKPDIDVFCWIVNGRIVVARRRQNMAAWDFMGDTSERLIVAHWCYYDEFCNAARPKDAPMIYLHTDDHPDMGYGPEA